jgi:drug/metabolite transporter (DMT)-like permease
VALVLSAGLLRRARVSMLGSQRGLLLLRGLLGFVGLTCVFTAVTRLPLAEATVLQYLHPVFTAIIAGVVLGEAVGRGVVFGIGASLLGVLLVAKPGFLWEGGAAALDPTAVMIAIGGALASASAYVVVRRLARSEHPLVIVLYFPMVTVPASLPLLAGNFLWPRGLEWLGLLGVGLLAQVGQVALTRGMQTEPAARATALSYLQVAFAAGFGLLLFGAVPDGFVVAGSLLILSGSFLAGRSS